MIKHAPERVDVGPGTLLHGAVVAVLFDRGVPRFEHRG